MPPVFGRQVRMILIAGRLGPSPFDPVGPGQIGLADRGGAACRAPLPSAMNTRRGVHTSAALLYLGRRLEIGGLPVSQLTLGAVFFGGSLLLVLHRLVAERLELRRQKRSADAEWRIARNAK